MLRARLGVLAAGTIRRSVRVLIALFGGDTALERLDSLLADIAKHGVEPALAAWGEADARQRLLDEWIGTRTWAESFAFLAEHAAELLHDEVMALLAELAGFDDPVARQHLALLLLLDSGIPVESAMQITTDPSTATDHALDAVETADLRRVQLLVTANPAALVAPGSGPLLRAVLLLASGQPEEALRAGGEAAAVGSETQRRAHVVRLRRLAAAGGDEPGWHPRVLDQLIAVLQSPPAAG
jgi:hypothetical protein